jgi:hypothetical protein
MAVGDLDVLADLIGVLVAAWVHHDHHRCLALTTIDLARGCAAGT